VTPPAVAPAEAARPPEDVEQRWLREVYAGDGVPQLTLRAVSVGMLLGALMAFSNVYVGLKAGWSLNVAITACIISYAIFKVVPLEWLQAPRALRLFDRHGEKHVTILENNCMQSTASAAGYSTGSTVVSAFSAYLMITGHHMPFWTVAGLVLFLALLGVFLAIPMKRRMINVEQLPFPSGTASAVTLRSLHERGSGAAGKAKSLFGAMGAAAALEWFRDGWPRFIPDYLPLSRLLDALGLSRLARIADPAAYTFSLQTPLVLAGAGAIMGMRTSLSMLLGAILNYGVIAPWLFSRGIIPRLGFRGIVSWSVWSGVAIMTSAALLTFFWEWRTIVRAVQGVLGGGRRSQDDPMRRLEVPGSWFAVGILVAGAGCLAIERTAFGIPVLLGILAIGVSAVMALVASRATGETDVTPIGPVGKITQLLYGVLIPQDMTANLMTANITSSMAIGSADLLTDLKSGYLLGANPRKQFLAQFFGVFGGALAATAAFYIVIPNAEALGGDRFPAPAAQVWRAVAQLLAQGLASLPPYAIESLVVGLVVGVVLTVAERLLPRARPFIPSPIGLGMAFTFQGYSSVSFALGATAAWIYKRVRPAAAEQYTIPVASGVIAGESLTGVLIALLTIAGLL
jgi:putative OPT family oligopeptide transporter